MVLMVTLLCSTVHFTHIDWSVLWAQTLLAICILNKIWAPGQSSYSHPHKHVNHIYSLCSVSAGVGRTGCFIVIEAMLERMKHEKSVDIYGHVTCMRAQRNYMVQTEDQYIFIHEALLEAATCGTTEVAARNLYAHIQKLNLIPPGETVTAMELEFKVAAFCFVLFCYMGSM